MRVLVFSAPRSTFAAAGFCFVFYPIFVGELYPRFSYCFVILFFMLRGNHSLGTSSAPLVMFPRRVCILVTFSFCRFRNDQRRTRCLCNPFLSQTVVIMKYAGNDTALVGLEYSKSSFSYFKGTIFFLLFIVRKSGRTSYYVVVLLLTLEDIPELKAMITWHVFRSHVNASKDF